MLVAQFLVALYGGYFGGAVGLMMMAVWSLFDPSELASMARAAAPGARGSEPAGS